MPEVWQAVARRSGIEALTQTTRDIPVYDDLMRMRLRVMEENDLTLSVIHEAIDELEPLPDAREFLAWARRRFQVVVLSDTFYDFAMPLMAKLGHPLLLCHKLRVDGERIVGYQIRQPDPKRHAVRAFQAMNYRVLAAGDSFNDIGMLQEADVAVFVNAPPRARARYPEFAAVDGLPQLRAALTAREDALQ